MKKKILTFLLAISMMLGSLPVVNAADTPAAADKTETKTEAAATPTPTATPKATATPSATPKATAAPAATATPAPTVLDSEYKWGFSDVPEDNINGEAVYELAKKGIINGYGDKTFKPDNNVTRAEFVKMLVEFAGWGNIYGDNVSTGFPDVDAADGKESHWAAKYIKVVASQKIVNGYEDGSFRPDNQVKYEEAMKMMVCYLGRDGVAQNRVQTNPETKLYPDAYMFVGSNLGLSKLVGCKVGDYISRAMVAQIIYNSTGTERLQMQTTVINTGRTGSKSPGGGGGSSTPKPRPGKKSGVDGSGKISGRIVAVKAPESYDDTIMRIDDEILTYDYDDGTELKKSQIIIKADNPNIDGFYYLLIDEAEKYSNYLGYYIRGTYTYYSDEGDGIYKLSDVDMSETEVFSYSSEDINREKTMENIAENTVYFYSDAGKKNYKIPENLADLNIIYNGRIVDMSAIADMPSDGEGSAEGGDSATEGGDGATEGSAGATEGGAGATEGGAGATEGGNATEEDAPELPITIYDFIPEDGDVEIVECDDEVSLIRINSYEMYYVKETNISTKVVTDNFRKNEDGTPVTVNLAEKPGCIVYISDAKSGNKITVSSLSMHNVIRIRQSKCGTLTCVKKEKTSSAKHRLKSVEGQIYMLAESSSTSSAKEYLATDYFCDFVWPDLEIAVDDTATVYFVDLGTSGGKKITNMVKSAAVMYLGYLASAEIESDVSGNIAKFKIHAELDKASGIKNKATTEYEFYKKIKVDGVEYTSAEAAIAKLKEKAAIINEGKPEKLTSTAETSQPIRYVLDGNYIKEIETLKFDAENSYKGTPMRYTPSNNSGKMFTAENGDTLSIPSSPIFMFVTNNRTDKWYSSYFKFSDISGLVENKMYNVEPYYLPNSTGEGTSRRLFVIYNQDIDGTPTHMSDMVMVKDFDQLENNYKITVYNGASEKNINSHNHRYFEEAYLLDENFERTGEKRAIKRGDIIRYGDYIDDTAINFEILYNVEEDLENVKGIYINSENIETTDFEEIHALQPTTQEKNIRHLVRIGMISDSSIYSSDPDIIISYIVPDGNGGYKTYSKSDGFTKALSNLTVILHDFTAEDKTIKPKTAKMSDLRKGDMVFLWRGKENVYKAMYAVRYKDDILGKYESMRNGTYGQEPQPQSVTEEEIIAEPELMAVEETVEIIEEAAEEVVVEETEIIPEETTEILAEEILAEEIIPEETQEVA